MPEPVRGSRLRILHVCEAYPPVYGGGAALYVRDVCQYLAAQGHQVTVLTGEDADRDELSLRADRDGEVQLLRYCVPAFARTDPEGWRLSVVGWRAYQRRVAVLTTGVLAKVQPDLVNYHATRPLGEEPIRSASQQGYPIVAMLHEAWLVCGRVMLLRSPDGAACSGPGFLRCLGCLYSHYDGSSIRAIAKAPWRIARLGLMPAYRLWSRRSARARIQGGIAYSRFMAAVHGAHLPGPIRYVNLGVNMANLGNQRPVRPRVPFRFGFFGGLQPTKGLPRVLEAAQRLRDRGHVFEIRVWGPQLHLATVEIKRRGLENHVVLRGAYAIDGLWDAYSEVDMAIMATEVAEPFGRIPQEAAAAGAPSIVPAIGGLVEQIRHGVDGLQFRFRDGQDLCRQMESVLADRLLLPRLIANLPAVPDTRVAAQQVEAIYYEVVDAWRSSSVGNARQRG